jgi:inhibitor of cysteine peptidase
MTRVLLVCVLVVALAFVWGCSGADASGPLRIGEAANGTQVSLPVGRELAIALPGNLTTGYDWALAETLPSQLATVSYSYDTTAAAGVVGAGGVRTFVYRAAAAGSAKLTIVYARPWEKGVAPEKTFTVTVVVQ